MAEARPDGIPKKVWDEALKKAKDYNKELSQTDAILDSISQRVIGMGIDAWFDRVEKSASQLAQEQERINQISNQLEASQQRLNNELADGLTNATTRVELATALSSLDTSSLEAFSNRLTMANDLSAVEQSILNSSGSLEQKYQMINNLLAGNVDLTEEVNSELANTIAGYTSIAGSVESLNNELSTNITRLGEAEAELARVDKKAFNFMKGLEEYANVFGKQSVDFLFEFDKVISDAQRDTGLFFKGNTKGMADLTSKTRAFGMSISDTTELFQELGDSLRTTNFDMLSTAVEDFAAIQKAIGISSGELAGVAGEMIRWGKTSQDVEEYFESINKSSQSLGVNTRNVVRQITQNIGKMRQFGFTEGEDSLERMAVQAELLRVEIDEIFDVSEKARTLEGALDMAAELQLAGGSFSQINPMDLLAAARKGPEELGKILTSMGSDIGRFNKETGAYEFDPIDADRLKIVADATGLSMDFIQNSIMKTDEMSRKTDIFGNVFSGVKDMDKELAKSSFAQMLTVGEDGKIEVSKDFEKIFKDQGITSKNLADVTGDNVEEILKSAKAEQKSIKDRAQMNQSLEEAFQNFVGSVQSVFSFFTPVLNTVADVLTKLSASFSGLPEIAKQITGGALLLGYGVNKMMKLFKGKSLFQSIGEKIRGGGGSSPSTSTGGGGGAGGGIGAGINGLAKGIKQASKHAMKIKMTGIAKLAGSLAMLGGVIVGFGAAVAAVGGEASMGQLVTAATSLVLLGGAVALFSKIPVDVGGVAKGALAMGIIGAALIPISYAFGMLSEMDFGNVLASLGIITLATLGIIGLGALLTGPQIIAVAVGVATLIGIGAALAVAGAGLMVAGMAFEKLAEINWGGLSQMAGALFTVTPAILAFGMSAMAFANPIALFGLLAMTGNLALLAAVMVPLASSLTIGAEGMEKFANSIDKLKTAVSDINVSKLEEIQETASQMASASRSSAFDKLASTVQGMFGGSGSGSQKETERKIVVEIQMDGKTLQSKILKDTRQMAGR